MSAPFVAVEDVMLKEVFRDGFSLEVNGYDEIRCRYMTTYGYEGFGPNRHKVAYPCGAIVMQINGVLFRLPSFQATKEKLASVLNSQFKARA